jgi:hypothetical protein
MRNFKTCSFGLLFDGPLIAEVFFATLTCDLHGLPAIGRIRETLKPFKFRNEVSIEGSGTFSLAQHDSLQ